MFKYGNETIFVTEDYVYLGAKFYHYLNEKGNKTLFAILRKARQLNFPIDVTSQLFDSVVLPAVWRRGMYGAPFPSSELEKKYL